MDIDKGRTSIATLLDDPQLEALKSELTNEILATIQATMTQKDDSLWIRGQAEISKLQVQQQKTMGTVLRLQEKQAALGEQSNALQNTLLEVTSRFEIVFKDMREVLRNSQARGDFASPTPSMVSTSASEMQPEELRSQHTPEMSTVRETPGVPSSDRGMQGTPASTRVARADESLGFDFREPEESKEVRSRGFSTPPRHAPQGAENLLQQLVGPDPSWNGMHTRSAHGHVDRGMPPRWPGSPAPAVIKLANALPSTSVAPSPSPGGFKRLHLAECLDQQSASSTAPCEALLHSPASTMCAHMLPVPGSPSRPSPIPFALAPEMPVMSPTPHGSPCSWPPDFLCVQLVKEKGFLTLGIEVDKVDGALQIQVIDERGLMGMHNARQQAEINRVQVGDRIVEVNGLRQDPERMLQECKEATQLKFIISHSARHPSASPGPSPGWEAAGLLSSPEPGRLRADASVFVPSAQKEVAMPPPGLECYDVGVPGLPPIGVLGPHFVPAMPGMQATEPSHAAGSLFGDLERPSSDIKRALFT